MEMSVNRIVLDTEFGKIIFERCTHHITNQPHFNVKFIKDEDEKELCIGCIDNKELQTFAHILREWKLV